jgi:hypothetical protein
MESEAMELDGTKRKGERGCWRMKVNMKEDEKKIKRDESDRRRRTESRKRRW